MLVYKTHGIATINPVMNKTFDHFVSEIKKAENNTTVPNEARIPKLQSDVHFFSNHCSSPLGIGAHPFLLGFDGSANGLVHLGVSGAAAEIAAEGVLDLVLSGVGVAVH